MSALGRQAPPKTKRIGRSEYERDPNGSDWRLVNWERRARRDIMREHGIATGRQWKRLKRRLRREERP